MSFLTRKYPFETSKLGLRESVIYSAVVFAILFFFQPFGFSQYNGNKLVTSLEFGLVTLFCSYIYGCTVCKLLPQYIRPWRIWHQIVNILGLTLFIALCNYLLFSYIFHVPLDGYIFLMFLYWTLLIGIIISIFSTFLAYNRHLRNQMETLLSNTTEEQKGVIVTIHDTNVRANDLVLPLNDLLYIEAQKNNVSVGYLKDGKFATTEVHTTLTTVLEELHTYDNIFQCHRSFIVNINNITSAKGNSNGYQLTVTQCPQVIPVSRTFVPQLKSFIV